MYAARCSLQLMQRFPIPLRALPFLFWPQRWNFTLPECKTTSLEFDFFMSLLVHLRGSNEDGGGGSSRGEKRIRWERVALGSLEQHFVAYERDHMHLFRLYVE